MWRERFPAILLLTILSAHSPGCTEDLDGDGYPSGADCDDGDPSVYPGAVEYWDRKDNDCDGVEDVSPYYRWIVEEEPNDALIDTCYRGQGQWLGTLAPTGLATFVDGRIDTVVPENYDLGDADCLGFDIVEDAILHVQITWPEPDADLDFVLWSEWEGEKAAFIASQSATSYVDGGSSDGAMDAGYGIYLWMGGYDGQPTTYRLTLWTTWATVEEES